MFSLDNIPVPLTTPLGRSISTGFKYRVLGYNADTPLEEVAQMYAHRRSEVATYREALRSRWTFVVAQEWDGITKTFK